MEHNKRKGGGSTAEDMTPEFDFYRPKKEKKINKTETKTDGSAPMETEATEKKPEELQESWTKLTIEEKLNELAIGMRYLYEEWMKIAKTFNALSELMNPDRQKFEADEKKAPEIIKGDKK